MPKLWTYLAHECHSTHVLPLGWRSEVMLLSRVRLFVTPWTVAHQALPSMGFSRQEYWSGLPFLPLGDLPDPGIEPWSPALQADALTSEPPGKPQDNLNSHYSTPAVVNCSCRLITYYIIYLYLVFIICCLILILQCKLLKNMNFYFVSQNPGLVHKISQWITVISVNELIRKLWNYMKGNILIKGAIIQIQQIFTK